MAWVALIVAGLFEIGFTTCLKLSAGFTRVWPSLGFFAFAIASFFCLNMAIRTIPLGTAYAVWTGIGAAGTAVVGMFFFHDPAGFLRIFLLIVLVGSIIGLKIISPS